MGDLTLDAIVPFLLLAFAAYRIARFIVLDEFLGDYASKDHPRGTGLRRVWDWVLFEPDGEARNPVTDWLGKLSSCVWCTGFWVSLALVCAWFHLWPWQLGLVGWVYAFAVAGVQGFLGSRVEG